MSLSRRKLTARHLWQYDPINQYPGWESEPDIFVHRLDVKFPSNKSSNGFEQYHTNQLSKKPALTKRQIDRMRVALNKYIASKGYSHKIGSVKSYSMEEWRHNRAAQKAWNSIG